MIFAETDDTFSLASALFFHTPLNHHNQTKSKPIHYNY